MPDAVAAPPLQGRRRDLTIRRERTRDGWCLHFTGHLAASDLCDRVFDEVDRLFAPTSD